MMIEKGVTVSERKILEPNPGHPITIKPVGRRVVVHAGGKVIADTREALALDEAAYPTMHYIPRKDVAMDLLTRTDHTTYCPYKGDAAYCSIGALGDIGVNAIWTYEQPYEAVRQIAGHLAFYPDGVSITVEP